MYIKSFTSLRMFMWTFPTLHAHTRVILWHVLCFFQVNMLVYLTSDFHYLRHSSFVWWLKLTAHIQELGIKKLTRRKRVTTSSMHRLACWPWVLLRVVWLGIFLRLLRIFTVSIFRSLPLDSLDSTDNEIPNFYLGTISLNALILGTKQEKWLEISTFSW